jgi:hypothetical protein
MDRYLQKMGKSLDIVFDIDLGELVDGHHVVLRGIELGRTVGIERWEADRDAKVRKAQQSAVGGAMFRSEVRALSEGDHEVVGTRRTEPELHYELYRACTKTRENIRATFTGTGCFTPPTTLAPSTAAPMAVP